jgi:hypothetical protein
LSTVHHLINELRAPVNKVEQNKDMSIPVKELLVQNRSQHVLI